MNRTRRLRVMIVVSLALIATGCERNRRGMQADQQIAVVDGCAKAKRDAVAASDAEREDKITRWAGHVQGANGLCTVALHEALIIEDDKTHVLALEVLKRIGWREHKESFVGDLDNQRLTPEQLARVFASLKAISGQDFGDDRAAWQTWLRSQS